MAVTIKKGDIIVGDSVRTGTSAKGSYFMCRVKADKGNGKITIWNNDGFNCSDGDQIRIVEIESCSHSSRKYQEKWYEETSAVCKLELVGKAPAYSDLTEAGDEDLPF